MRGVWHGVLGRGKCDPTDRRLRRVLTLITALQIQLNRASFDLQEAYMQIAKVSLENFRSIERLEVDFGNLTSLVGANNCGKSTVLKAIDLFFDAAAKVTAADYYMHDQTRTISISIEFEKLTPEEIKEFGSAVKDNRLHIVREFGGEAQEAGEYAVSADVNPAFEEFRNENNGTKKRTIYADLRRKFVELIPATGEEMEENLRAWERENPSQLEFKKIRGFFGAKNVANGKLKKKTSVRLVPAVKDASEETSDAKRSPVVGLLSEIVKQTFENKKEFTEFISLTNKTIAELSDPASVPQLAGISERLTNAVSRYYSDTNLIADLNKANEINVTFPSPLITVVHRGLKVDVADVGHGLQRAIFFSLVQFLAEEHAGQSRGVEETLEFSEAQSDIILLIEEPEIYQHPIKQALFYDAFKEIAAGFNRQSGIRIQVIFATHSEKFVSIKEISNIRIISKKANLDGLITQVKSLSISDFSHGMAAVIGATKPLSNEAFSAGLHIFNREVSEGFLAEKIVLVEGVSDKAILEAALLCENSSAHREGISIIEVGGKTKIDKPLFAFRALGIPVHVVFDNDSAASDRKLSAKRNRNIQIICDATDTEDFPAGVFGSYSCFEGNLERYLESVTGDRYSEFMNRVCDDFGLNRADALKTPAVVSAFLVRAKASGINYEVLDRIIDTVRRM
jgi:putative ATP-dependent endonuclease of OLD family